MATPSDLAASIEPGSLPYGERDDLVAGLQAAVGGGGGQPGPGGPGTPAPLPTLDGAEDPIAALLTGGLDPGGGDLPITAGLSVGPGPGPGGLPTQVDPTKVRLQQIATQARNPLVRAAARLELRRLVGERL